MANAGNNESPERQQTDESLRGERDKADRAFADRRGAVVSAADLIVRRARTNADAVLHAARRRADVADAEPPTDHRSTIAEDRVLEDEVLRQERASADESLRRERDETSDALTRLLPLERERTDRYLLTERARSDNAVSNRDDFLGIVSHDLRDLLGGVVMTAGTMAAQADAGAGGDQTRAHVGRIQRYAARMNRLIGDLVDVASIDAGKLAIAAAPGDAVLLVAEAVEAFRAPAAAKHVAIVATATDGPMLTAFDHDRMLQVFGNLIANALKFTSDGGKIAVGATGSGDDWLFSVRDTGVGIPRHLLGAIFERFMQVAHHDRRGLGLGLHISKCIIEAHGGRIWAESVEGEGSTISFTLPRSGFFPLPQSAKRRQTRQV
jgi:signal transduction histidine kinase